MSTQMSYLKPKKLTPAVVKGTGLEFLDEGSLVAIENVGEDMPSGAMIILASSFFDVSVAAGTWIAYTILGPHAAVDFVYAKPQTDKWVVDELLAILDVLKHYPDYRHVILLTEAQSLDARAWDRLLVVAEEPSSPLLLILTVNNTALLPATIRSRAADIIDLHLITPDQRANILARDGVTNAAAQEAVSLAGTQPTLASLFALSHPLRIFARNALSSNLAVDLPGIAAIEKLNTLNALARVLCKQQVINNKDPADKSPDLKPLKDFSKSVRFDELDSNEKDMLRVLLALWCANRRSLLLDLLNTTDSSISQSLFLSLQQLERFEMLLRIPVTPPVALSALFATTPDMTSKTKPKK
jgi:hypothetical protein